MFVCQKFAQYIRILYSGRFIVVESVPALSIMRQAKNGEKMTMTSRGKSLFDTWKMIMNPLLNFFSSIFFQQCIFGFTRVIMQQINLFHSLRPSFEKNQARNHLVPQWDNHISSVLNRRIKFKQLFTCSLITYEH